VALHFAVPRSRKCCWGQQDQPALGSWPPKDQTIVRNDHWPFERFYGFLSSTGQIICICGKLGRVGNLGRTDSSRSSDSDRFLAAGSVSRSDRLVIELVQPPDTPAAILIKWPPQPTVTDPAKLTATIAAIVRVLGRAQIELAARRAAGK
jgi:hypothetical protein